MLASSYPILDIFLTTLYFFLFIIWIWLLFMVFIDIFRSHDMGGVVKAVWLIALLIFPFLGLLIYVIVRGSGMAERDAKQMAAAHQAQDQYIRSVAAGSASASSSAADQIEKAHALLNAGAISQSEFDAIKAKALA